MFELSLILHSMNWPSDCVLKGYWDHFVAYDLGSQKLRDYPGRIGTSARPLSDRLNVELCRIIRHHHPFQPISPKPYQSCLELLSIIATRISSTFRRNVNLHGNGRGLQVRRVAARARGKSLISHLPGHIVGLSLRIAIVALFGAHRVDVVIGCALHSLVQLQSS